MDTKMIFQTARSLMNGADFGFQETADLAMKGFVITKDVAELNIALKQITQISLNSVLAVMMIFTMKYVGPKIFYPYLLLEPLVYEGADDALISTSHGLMVHTFDKTNYTFRVDSPRATLRLELVDPSVVFQSFEFKTIYFDSVLTGSIKVDIGKMIVEAKTEYSFTNCLVKMRKLEVVRVEDFAPKIFIDSNPNMSSPLSEKFADYLDKHLQDMVISRIHLAVIERFNRFPIGRILMNCSDVTSQIPE